MTVGKIGAALSTGFLYSAATCFLLGTGVTVIDVGLRATTGANVPAAIELTSLSIGLGALLSMPVCYARRSHVTAKLLSELSPRLFNRPLGLLGALISIGFAGLLIWIMGQNSLSKLGSAQTTSDLGLSMPLALTVVSLTLAAALIAAVAGFILELRQDPETKL
jgi:TRAP-type C4-dicarboxylate transport system permease small subunit